MRRLLSVLILASLSACLKIGTPGDSTGGSTSGGSGGAVSTDAGVSVASGIDCGVDPASGVALCLGITSCPTVVVDADQMPGCGFRISGNVIDLECLCNDSLCPVGSAASCADAKALLADQTSQGVCAGIAEGRCTTVSQSATSTSGTASSSCDKSCRADCGGDPACIAFCGC
jgi:hypothetical protein